jgi:hypothetical protein
LQALLGIYPFASGNLLALVHPRLPAGVRSATIHRLRVGEARVSLRFTRRQDGSAAHEVLDCSGGSRVIEVPPPQHAVGGTAGWRDRVLAWLIDHAPTRTADMVRIALGTDEDL